MLTLGVYSVSSTVSLLFIENFDFLIKMLIFIFFYFYINFDFLKHCMKYHLPCLLSGLPPSLVDPR